MVNPFDAVVISHLNQYAQRSWALDNFVVLCTNYLLRALGIVPLYWWAWFDGGLNDSDGDADADGDQAGRRRSTLVFGMIGCVVALLCSRGISALLPFRERPLYNPDLHFRAPYGQSTHMLIGWSAFPSDHAAVYFTLAMCLWLVSRKLGLFAFFWALFVTCLPRVYLGLHYPTDIIAGALLGIGVGSLAMSAGLRRAVAGPVLRFQEYHPGAFYALFFLFGLQLATAFESVLVFREYFSAIAHHAMRVMH